MLSTYLSSYFIIASVRVKFQLAAVVIPSFFITMGIPILYFMLPFMDVDFDDLSLVLDHIPWNEPNIRDRMLFQIGEFVCGLLAFTIATRHVWFDRSYPYALERTLFDSPAYRGAWSLPNILMQRKRTDIASFMIENTFDKKSKKSSKKVKNNLLHLAKLAAMAGPSMIRRKSIYDTENMESVPMIFICTTLWHEEDNEMRTLVISLLRLINYVHLRKQDETLRQQDRFNLEINILFDNVFESHNCRENPQKTLPSWLPKEFSEWQTLNKWVYNFGTILAELLHQRQLGRCVEDAKTVLTPYGGRLEYKIQDWGSLFLDTIF